jgi:hypothetical protein
LWVAWVSTSFRLSTDDLNRPDTACRHAKTLCPGHVGGGYRATLPFWARGHSITTRKTDILPTHYLRYLKILIVTPHQSLGLRMEAGDGRERGALAMGVVTAKNTRKGSLPATLHAP